MHMKVVILAFMLMRNIFLISIHFEYMPQAILVDHRRLSLGFFCRFDKRIIILTTFATMA